MKLNVGYVVELVSQKGIKVYFKYNKSAIIVMVRAQSFEIYAKVVEAKAL